MVRTSKPDTAIAEKTLPKPLYKAVIHIFRQKISGVVLVGGTALSGFYAGHRRSDDIDLFVKNGAAFKQTVLAVMTLKEIGANIKISAHSKQYLKSVCELAGHVFTVDIVLDENIFTCGSSSVTDNGIVVADIATIFKMKCATLLSRCSEKDLFDLIWLFQYYPDTTLEQIVIYGRQIDEGMTAETLLYSISSSSLSKDACDFAIDSKYSSVKVFKQIQKLKEILIYELNAYLNISEKNELSSLVEKIKSLV